MPRSSPKADDNTPTGLRSTLFDRVRAAPDVATVAEVDRALVDVAGVGVPTLTVRPPPGRNTSIELVTVDGRAPVQPDELALGPATAARLGVAIGDTVVVGTPPQRMRIVGHALFPAEVHSTFDVGAWLTPPTFDAVASDPESQERLMVLRFRDGVDAEAAIRASDGELGPAVESVDPVEVPVELSNLRNVRRLPSLLAAFLALLAVAALGHVLATSVRRRRQDFAVLRALGITRWACAASSTRRGRRSGRRGCSWASRWASPSGASGGRRSPTGCRSAMCHPSACS